MFSFRRMIYTSLLGMHTMILLSCDQSDFRLSQWCVECVITVG
jgi:hypothetical protein